MSPRNLPLYCICALFVSAAILSCRSEPAGPKEEQTGDSDAPQKKSDESKQQAPAFELEEGFVFLANDSDMGEFTVPVGDAATWSIDGHTIKCSGRPRGYLKTKQSYRNFTLRLDFRYARPKNLKDDDKFKGNTGYLMYISDENTPWPACVEVQGKHVQLAKIVAIGGAEAVEATDNEQARIDNRKPAGQWNSLEIQSNEGALVSILNGVKIAESRPGPLTEGPIGFQAEDWAIDFRNVRIREE